VGQGVTLNARIEQLQADLDELKRLTANPAMSMHDAEVVLNLAILMAKRARDLAVTFAS
jgi:hypothetical protein